MADILDEDKEKGELEIVEEQIQEKKPDNPPSDDPTYRGKAIEDIIRMHQEAKKVIDRQASEVGEVRKLADELIKSQLYTKPKETETPVEVDFFANPKEAIRQAVESDPAVLNAQQMAQMVQRQMAVQKMEKLHPDHAEITQSQDFLDFVKAKPTRIKLFQQANNYDADAADDLISTFKELRAARVRPLSDAEKAARDKNLKSASVDSGGSGESSQKIYRRKALIQLRLRDPKAFEARKEEIIKAYSEGRVR